MVSVVYPTYNSKELGNLTEAEWLAAVKLGRSDGESALIDKAFAFAKKAHSSELRVSGEPYLQHVIAVANILASLNMDVETVAAALLHDTLRNPTITLEKIADELGRDIAHLVDGVAKMEVLHISQVEDDKHTKAMNAEALRKMLLAMVEDVRVVLIKLADRVHNMRTLTVMPLERQHRIAKETLDIYAPLANRLGISQIKWELEDLAFRYLEPELYKKIARLLNERRVDREKYIENFIGELTAALKANNVEATVSGRPKHIYSIYRKMSRKELDYSQIYDVRAARIIVDDVKDCYAALGIVHSLWRYIPGEFDDYVANPKDNDYRSLHTAVIGPEGKTVEVQIRTRDMHQHNEYGVAAHWRYKENYGPNAEFERKIAWLRQLLEWKDEVKDASEFVDQVKTDIFQDRVYVFTPKGHVIDLPVNSTPLDFAYHIHSELGHRCRGAKVNGHIVPLTYALKTGEQVELLTIKKGEPSRDWLSPHLGFLHSSKARYHVQRWFKQQNYDSHVNTGRVNLQKELQRLGFVDINLERLARALEFRETDDMYAAFARGELKLAQIVARVEHVLAPKPHEEAIPITSKRSSLKEKQSGDVKIQGVGNLLTHFAKCCKPLPGDDIAGYITKGRGVTIHRYDCQNMMRYTEETPERVIAVSWGEVTENTYPVGVKIIAYDRHGLLRDITAVLANEEVNVIAVNTQSNKKTHHAVMELTLEISDIEKLSRVLGKISQLPNIIHVQRTNL